MTWIGPIKIPLKIPSDLRVSSFHIKNFKSLMDVEFELRNFNLLIGKNGSGKTNILEAFKLLKKVVIVEEFPHLPFRDWWGYQNIVYGGNIEENIYIKVGIKEKKEGEIFYEISLNAPAGSLQILYEKLQKNSEYIIREGEVIVEASIKELTNIKIPINYSIIGTFFPLSIKEMSPEERNKIFNFLAKMEFPISLCLQNIVLRRHVDLGLVRRPAPPQADVGERGENLASLLYRIFLREHKLPSRIEAMMEQFFPKFTLRFDLTPEGNVYMKILENGVELMPPSIPDGFYKALLILASIEEKPSILLIDEIENSLHAELLEYIIDELKEASKQGTTVIAATHSPIVIDLVDLEDLILVEKGATGTILSRVKEPDEVRRKLREYGITPSESWIYGKLV